MRRPLSEEEPVGSIWEKTVFFDVDSSNKVPSYYHGAIIGIYCLFFAPVLSLHSLASNSAGYVSNKTDAINFAIFCGSVRASLQHVDIVIFVPRPVPAQLVEISRHYDVSLLTYQPEKLLPTYIKDFHPSTLVLIFINFLFHVKDNAFTNVFRGLMVVDVENTIVQTDPFELLPNWQALQPSAKSEAKEKAENDANALYIVVDALGKGVGIKPRVAEKIEACFGSQMRTVFTEIPILHGGMLLGFNVAMKRFASIYSMVNTGMVDIGKNLPSCAAGGSPTTTDAIVNVIVRTGIGSDFIAIKSEENLPVLDLSSTTLVDTSEAIIVNNQTQKIMSRNGVMGSREQVDNGMFLQDPPPESIAQSVEIASVVRKYSRIRSLHARLASSYVYWLDKSSTDFEKLLPVDNICDDFSILPQADILHGQCDMREVPGSSYADCCEICLENFAWEGNSACSAFVHVDEAKMCYLKNCDVASLKGYVNSGASAMDGGKISGYLKFS